VGSVSAALTFSARGPGDPRHRPTTRQNPASFRRRDDADACSRHEQLATLARRCRLQRPLHLLEQRAAIAGVLEVLGPSCRDSRAALNELARIVCRRLIGRSALQRRGRPTSFGRHTASTSRPLPAIRELLGNEGPANSGAIGRIYGVRTEMGILDYIPVVATIKHAFFDDPPGRKVADYVECATTALDCETQGTDLAVADCERCIIRKAAGFFSELLGENLLPDVIRFGIGAVITIFAERIVGALAVRLSVGAATGIGVVLAGDAVIDAGITLSRAGDISKAAEQAKAALCRCPPR
jgi:hypothetical protein